MNQALEIIVAGVAVLGMIGTVLWRFYNYMHARKVEQDNRIQLLESDFKLQIKNATKSIWEGHNRLHDSIAKNAKECDEELDTIERRIMKDVESRYVRMDLFELVTKQQKENHDEMKADLHVIKISMEALNKNVSILIAKQHNSKGESHVDNS